MKILQIGKYYEPYLGGMENHIYDLSHSIKKDFQVTVLAYNTKNKTEEFNDKGVHVVKIATMGKLRSQQISFAMFKWMKKLSKDADIIHIHVPNPLAEAALLRANPKGKIIVTYHSDIIKQKLLFHFYKPIALKILNKADKIICTTERYAKYSPVLSKFMGKTKIIPFGIQITKPSAKTKKEASSIRKKYGPKIVLFVGRLIYYKGVEYLIKAFKDCPDKQLLIIGTGELDKSLKKMATELKLNNVHFLGRIADLNPYYMACDIFSLPSVARTESFGIVQLEAMSYGKPLIGTEIQSGTSYVNKNGVNGIVVNPKDSKALSKAINYLFDNHKIMAKYGSNARKRVLTEFNEKKIIEEYKRFYRGYER